MSDRVLQSIRDLLDEQGIDYREVHHQPTRTSEQSAAARGESVRIGGKALVLKVGHEFHLFVLSAARKVDSAAIRQYFTTRKMRFATKEELQELADVVPGGVPPFGRPILPLDLFVDESIPANEKIAFNAGSLTNSVIMSTEDYLAIAKPTIFCFSTPQETSDA